MQEDTGCSEFTFRTIGRDQGRYTEGDKSVVVGMDLLTGPYGRALDATSIEEWDTPNGREPIDEETRCRIIENIRRHMHEEGVEVFVDTTVRECYYRGQAPQVFRDCETGDGTEDK